MPTRDLSLLYECPRCHDVRAASELVSKRNTVPAVPAADALAYETAIEPQRVFTEPIPPTVREPDAPPAAQPPPTLRMPNAPGPVPARVPAMSPIPVDASPHRMTPPMPGALHAAFQLVVAPARPPVVPNTFPAPLPQPHVAAPLPALAPGGQPPPVYQPGFKTRAIGGLVAGTVAAGRFASFVLRCAAGADRFLHGKRAISLGGAACLVLVAPVVEPALGSGIASVVSLALFIGILALLGLARIDAFRDDTGFHASLVVRTIVEGFKSVGDWTTRLWQAPWGQKGIDGAKPILFGGLLTAASASIAAACGVDDDIVIAMQWSGLSALLAGGLVYCLGWWTLRRRARATGLSVDTANATVAKQVVQTLPFVVDCRDPSSADAVAKHSEHPLVRALLVELAKPWPRPHYDDERECQDRLAKRLRLAMPEANPRTERWIGERQRADLLLGDDKAGVLIELKARANSTTIDRLIGQAWKYLDVWKGRGPMLLIVCRTDPQDAAPRLQREIERMRREGHAVLAVFAMP